MNTFDLCLLRETVFISSGIDSVLWGAANGAVDRGEEGLPSSKKRDWFIGLMLLGLHLKSQVALSPILCSLPVILVSIQWNICDHWLQKESKELGRATVPSEYKVNSPM